MKTYIRTSDIFNNKDVNIRMNYIYFCYTKALKCGLQCRLDIGEKFSTLLLSGSKWGFIKYYLITLLKTENKMDGIKRLISIIFT